MRFFDRRLFVTSLIALSVGLTATIAQQTGGRGFELSNLDKTCKPCDDFYRYANGGWLAKNEIPAAFPAWGTTSKLGESNREMLRQILEEAAKNTAAPVGSNEQKIGAFYASCMDEAKIESAGAGPLAPH